MYFKWILTILIAFLGTAFSVSGQGSQESFETVDLQNIQEVRERILELTHLSSVYQKTSLEESLKYAEEGLHLALCKNDLEFILRMRLRVSLLNQLLGRYPEAMTKALKALEVAQQNQDSAWIPKSYHRLGSVYHFMERYPEAEHYFREEIKIYSAWNDSCRMSRAIYNLGHISRLTGRYEQALDYYFSCRKIHYRWCEKHGKFAALNGDIGKTYFAMGDYPKALEYQRKHWQRAVSQEPPSAYSISDACLNLAAVYNKLEDPEEAVSYGLEGLEYALQLGNREHQKEHYRNLAEAFTKSGKFEQALQFSQQYWQLKNSMLNEAIGYRIAELESKFELETKRKQIELLEKDKVIQEIEFRKYSLLIFAFSGLAVAILAILLLFFYNARVRQRQKNLELEQKLLRSQMNPHFIFNSLMAIQSFIYRNEPRETGRFLSKISKLIRKILESSIKDHVPLEEEIKTLEYYLDLQRLRFKNRFDYRIETQIDQPLDSIAIPPMLAQPFIENAIEHGFSRLDQDLQGQISIRYLLMGNFLILEIEDNGIGRKEAERLQQTLGERPASMGTAITQKRLTVFNRQHRDQIKMEIIDLEGKENQALGTKVIFQIPYRKIKTLAA